MTKRSFTKRLLSLLLVLVLVLPLNVYAAPQDAESGESAGVTWEKVDNGTIKGKQKGHEYKDSELSAEAVANGNVRVSIIVDGEATMEYIVRKGIARSRLTSIGYGKRRPLVPNDSDENRAINRRVEFKVTDF